MGLKETKKEKAQGTRALDAPAQAEASQEVPQQGTKALEEGVSEQVDSRDEYDASGL